MALENYVDFEINSKAILLFLVLILLISWLIQQPGNLPPGPWRFPVIGFLPQLAWYMGYKKREMHQIATLLCRKYGQICSFDVFGHVFVVINDFSAIKEAFNNPAISDKGFNNEFEEKMFGSYCEYYSRPSG